ncbi:MAG: hypothetical protein MUO41_10605 [Methyloceanibacter sp.]|jgi:hypothetical protein|nr:hypothetical protein [Methyloceanibacter sp.]
MRRKIIIDGVAGRGRLRSGRDVALLAALMLLAGCSHPDLPPVASTPSATPASATGDKTDAKYEAARKACKEETEKKGFGSVLGIFSRLRRGSAEEQFATCMKKQGYEA